MSIYFFYGDEEYNIELEINKLKKKLLDKNFASMNYKVADNPNFADLISLLRTQPMMFGNMMIVINCNEYFSKSFEDKELDEISKAIEDNVESLCIVFCAILPRGEGKKIDSRRKIYKILTKNSQMQEFPTFKTYEVEKIVNWINKEAKSQGVTMEKDAAVMLVERVGSNLRELAGEIGKLKLLAYPETTIKKAMVKEICISNEDLFTMADYLLKGEKGLALLEFQRLLDKKFYLEILSALQTMLRKWIIIKSKSNELPPSKIAILTGQHEFVVKTTIEKMRNTSLKSLVELKQNLIEAEFNIKSGLSVDVVAEIEVALLK